MAERGRARLGGEGEEAITDLGAAAGDGGAATASLPTTLPATLSARDRQIDAAGRWVGNAPFLPWICAIRASVTMSTSSLSSDFSNLVGFIGLKSDLKSARGFSFVQLSLPVRERNTTLAVGLLPLALHPVRRHGVF